VAQATSSGHFEVTGPGRRSVDPVGRGRVVALLSIAETYRDPMAD
jgi:hypothetical protein